MKELTKQAFAWGSMTGVFYALCITILAWQNLTFAQFPFETWCFRGTVIIAVCLGIVQYRRYWVDQQRKNPNSIANFSYPSAVKVGLLTALFLGFYTALVTLIQRIYLVPDYNETLKDIHRQHRLMQSPKTPPETIERLLNEDWAYFFTTEGGVLIAFGATLIWGGFTAITVGYMASRPPQQKTRPR